MTSSTSSAPAAERPRHTEADHAPLRRDPARMREVTTFYRYQVFDGETWELRNCPCTSTLIIVLDGEEAERARRLLGRE